MFERLIGNDNVKIALRRLYGSNRFPQSAIFAGQDGIGKKQFALEIAKSTICRNPIESSACQKCPPCFRSARFVFPKSEKKEDYERVFLSEHPDVGIVIPNKQTIYVGAIRGLESEANFRPFEAEKRFFIIDDAEKMSREASNALLKTLEEPAPTTYIFLITSFPAALLPTIHSRCQTIRFAPVSNDEVAEYLSRERKYSPDDSRLMAGISRGSISKALDLDPDLYRIRRTNMLGILESAAAGGPYSTMLRASEEINRSKNKDEFEENLTILQGLIHDVWKYGNDRSSGIVNFDLESRLKRINIRTSQLSKWLEEIESLRKNLRYNLNRKIASDALFVKMAGG